MADKLLCGVLSVNWNEVVTVFTNLHIFKKQLMGTKRILNKEQEVSELCVILPQHPGEAPQVLSNVLGTELGENVLFVEEECV